MSFPTFDESPVIKSIVKDATDIKDEAEKFKTKQRVKAIITGFLIFILAIGVFLGGYYGYSQINLKYPQLFPSIGNSIAKGTNSINKITNPAPAMVPASAAPVLASPTTESCKDIAFSETKNTDGSTHISISSVKIGECYNIPESTQTQWNSFFADSGMVDKFAAKIFTSTTNSPLSQDQIKAAITASIASNVFDLRIP